MIPLSEIRRAQSVIREDALRTPLVPLHAPELAHKIFLKLENLQPIGSFKIRGAANAIRQASESELAGGVVTASAGNMAQGAAWAARSLGIPATIIVPESAPQTKLAAIARLGGKAVAVPYERWWQTIVESSYPGLEGLFVHPVENEKVMAGNGTIGLEILEDLPDVEAVLIPWGGGGLSSGIASALRQLKPEVKIYGVEPSTAAPLTARFADSKEEVRHQTSFVDGAGSKSLLPKMWELGRSLLDGAFSASLDEIADAIRLMAERNRIIAEGAGAIAPAVALSGKVSGKIVCVVSGGNIDVATLTTILNGQTPSSPSY